MKQELHLNFLFFTRLFLYLLAFSFPIFHPAIAVSYDTFGILFWFVLIPGEMFLAYFWAPPRLAFKYWVPLAGAFAALLVLIFVGPTLDALMFFLGALAAALLTALVFKTAGRGRIIASIELFLLGLLYYKLLSFSRASEALAHKSHSLTQIILVVSICAFCLHAMVLYLSAFQATNYKKSRKELLFFFTLAVPVILLIALVLPPNFITHNIVLNKLDEEPKPETVPLDDHWRSLPFDRGRPGNTENDKDGKQGEGKLEGVPSRKWSQLRQNKPKKQYAVMVVATRAEAVYAADAYYGDFDPVQGFVFSRGNELNNFKHLRLIETWKIDPARLKDRLREPTDIFFLSTKAERYLAYQPMSIEPTILNPKITPFTYSYRTISGLSHATEADFAQLQGLSAQEASDLKSYLDVPLKEETRRIFAAYLKKVVPVNAGYYEKIDKILKSFEDIQYELGYTDVITVASMEAFLTTTKAGDCSEFSNTFALLARMAGIPARVVTGYLASWNLQNPSHRQGIMLLQKELSVLQDFPLAELLLVTSAHRHSWTQLYLPGYGWIDFESTKYAIPPPSGFNANDWDVVIPLIKEQEVNPRPPFPWWLIVRVLGVLLLGLVAALYLFRYGKLSYLKVLSGRRDARALQALYRLLLIHLADDGYALKTPAQTALEYARLYPELSRFAAAYTELRYIEPELMANKEEVWSKLRADYAQAVRYYKKPGLFHGILRVFNLRGLGY
jgi:transglutaminase-like putative cysteine protease